jgi:hypothetical protein
MIRAECHTFDDKYVVQFDATPLVRAGRCGDYNSTRGTAVGRTMGCGCSRTSDGLWSASRVDSVRKRKIAGGIR